MTTYRRKSANRGAGFTLVEILVVIVIIGLLAGMTTTVIVGARRSVRGSIVASQISQLSSALDEYKNKYGEYPPDLSDTDAVWRHIKKRWPRYNVANVGVFKRHIRYGCKLSSGYIERLDETSGINATNDVGFNKLDGLYVWNVESYISSVVFWLGGLPDANGKPCGFFANPKAPLGFSGEGAPLKSPLKAQREKPLYDFALKNVGKYWRPDSANYCYPADESATEFIPAFVQGGLPVVYFRPSARVPYEGNAADNIYKKFFLAETANGDGATLATPYARSVDDAGFHYYEDKRFQLIHPGVDGYFGPDESVEPRAGVPVVATKANAYPEDADNVVNFAVNGVLESEYDKTE